MSVELQIPESALVIKACSSCKTVSQRFVSLPVNSAYPFSGTANVILTTLHFVLLLTRATTKRDIQSNRSQTAAISTAGSICLVRIRVIIMDVAIP